MWLMWPKKATKKGKEEEKKKANCKMGWGRDENQWFPRTNAHQELRVMNLGEESSQESRLSQQRKMIQYIQ